MRGERPSQPHMAAIWDEAQRIGRTDVTDVIEDAITGLDAQARLFPDLFAHRVTEALLDAGLLPEVRLDKRKVRYPVNSGAPDFVETYHVVEKHRYVGDWTVARDTERGLDDGRPDE